MFNNPAAALQSIARPFRGRKSLPGEKQVFQSGNDSVRDRNLKGIAPEGQQEKSVLNTDSPCLSCNPDGANDSHGFIVPATILVKWNLKSAVKPIKR